MRFFSGTHYIFIIFFFAPIYILIIFFDFYNFQYLMDNIPVPNLSNTGIGHVIIFLCKKSGSPFIEEKQENKRIN